MIVDDVIWEVINNGHCSFKTKTETNTFCRNPYNLTGLCNRNSCPLANSRYATIVEDKGVCFLYMKTAERAHTPLDLWEKIKLERSYNKALEQIDENLEYWPEFLKHKSKQRFTRIRQVQIKKKRMKLAGSEQYEVISRKAEKREKSRLVKAEKSALIDRHIEEELLKNLKTGKYDEIYNYPLKNFNKALDNEEVEEEQEEEVLSEVDEIDNIFVADAFGENAGDDEDFDDEDDEGQEDKYKSQSKKDKNNSSISSKTTKSSKKDLIKKKRGRTGKKNKIEYEEEREVESNNKNINYDF